MASKTLITIVGPTAIGKTSLSIKLANNFNAPILSADSRQFFKETKIGTAVPSAKELAEAPHYFIQNKSIFDPYNVGQFERDAIKALDKLFEKHDVIVLVGGSGLYIDAVLKGLDYFPDIADHIREQLNNDFEKLGLETLQKRLKELDPETYQSIKIENPQRVIRALEVCIGTGKTYSSFKNKAKAPRNFNAIKIGITAEREIIYNRINQRVDIMMQQGLLEEVRSVYVHRKLNALQTVGYRELFSYLDGDFTLEFAISEIKKNTRRFAKRQITWFKKDPSTFWFEYLTNPNDIFNYLNKRIQELL